MRELVWWDLVGKYRFAVVNAVKNSKSSLVPAVVMWHMTGRYEVGDWPQNMHGTHLIREGASAMEYPTKAKETRELEKYFFDRY